MAQPSPQVSRGSPWPQPLKAVLPIASVTKHTSSINWKSENNSPLLSPTIRWKNRAYLESGLRSPGALNQVHSKICYGDTMSLKRTLSFDTIYLNQKAHYVYGNSYTTLCIDKSTQTLDGGCRLKHDNISDEEKIDRFFRHRFQRKDSSNSSSISDHSSMTQTPVISRGIRSSVEGLNQEIERLVLINSSQLNIEREEDRDISEGHRAPLAEILGLSRSVNTQTPSENFTPSSLSSGSPSRGELESPRGPRPPSEASSPGGGPSPKINRFLAREPPDGCEKVPLKFVEDQKLRKPMCDLSLLENFPPLAPSFTFTLRPSSGSAFYPLSTNSDPAPSSDLATCSKES